MTAPPLLPAETPADWLSHHLTAHYAVHSGYPSDDDRWYDLDALIANSSELLRTTFTRLTTEDGVPPKAAATYIAGWTAGMIADAVGFGLAAASAGFVVDPTTARWHQHRDGWIDCVSVSGGAVIVTADHPWAGLSGVDLATDFDTVVQRSVAALVTLVTPLIDACASLTRVGRAGLWNEVADGLGMAVTFQPALPVIDTPVDHVRLAVRTTGVPWKSLPVVQVIDDAAGPAYVGQKGGCCLAYTRADRVEVTGSDRYCSTCSLRDFDECRSHQLAWRARATQEQATH